MHIGLSQRILWHRGRAYDAIEHGWYSYFKHHTLYPIRNDPEQDFKKIAQSLDAFVITGGDDSILRRTTEIKLAKQAGKDLGKLIRMVHSDHAPTILAFFELGSVAVAIGGKKAFVTKYL